MNQTPTNQTSSTYPRVTQKSQVWPKHEAGHTSTVGAAVGAVGSGVGTAVGGAVGTAVGAVGHEVGAGVGTFWREVGAIVGASSPMPPPQMQHISFEVKSASSYPPHHDGKSSYSSQPSP